MNKSKSSILDMKWNIMFNMAEKYYIDNNNLLIPNHYICGEKKLGKWIGTQRANYKNNNNPFFTIDRIKKLESIKMIWDTKEARWEIMYGEALKYKEKHGNIRIPQSYITDSGIKLGVWINTQRKDFITNKISKLRQNKLENLGMIWKPKKLVKQSWNLNFQLLKIYINKYGDFPKTNYVTESGIKLGGWISCQRKNYINGKLSDKRKKRLNEINFIWDLTHNKWNQNFFEIKRIYDKCGNLNCINNKQNSWIKRQRILYHKKKLSKIQLLKLSEININYYLNSSRWNEMYNQASLFFLENGHLKVSKQKNSQNYLLGIWLDIQRKNYRSNNYDINKIKKLENIGMIWNPYKSPDLIWDEWFGKAKKFVDDGNNINLCKGSLKTWILAQRGAKKGLRGHLTSEKIIKLEKIGISWDPLNENWNKLYEYAKEYFKIHQMLNIPVNYVTKDGTKLGAWISRQRKFYKENINNINLKNNYKLRINKLNSINMIWDAAKILSNTSYQEKTIFYYLKQVFKDTVKITQWELIGYELDIFIPSLNVAIEYDGICHRNSLIKDLEKDEACKKNNIVLIRLREPDLPIISDGTYIIKLNKEDNASLEKAINELFVFLNLDLPDCNIKRDQIKILESYKNYNSRNWDSSFEKAYLIYKNNANILENNNFNLKIWIYTQRIAYKNNTLTQLQISKLKKIGFVSDPHETLWNNMYEIAKEYYFKYGNLLMPCYFISKENIKIGSWISKQREYYNKKKLTQKRIFLLEKIGMVWSIKKEYEIANINALKSYYKKNGNIKIPLTYVTKSGLYLGKWLGRKRKLHKKNMLSIEMISLLENYNVQWNILENRWDEMFEVAKKYFKDNNNIWISPNYITDNEIKLGQWISRQRKRCNQKRKLTKVENIQINKLNSINMIWDPYDQKWFFKYNCAKKYYKKFGNINISSTYITTDGVKLGMWISSQRQALRGNPNFLMTPERKKLLDNIHMDWKLKYNNDSKKELNLNCLHLLD